MESSTSACRGRHDRILRHQHRDADSPGRFYFTDRNNAAVDVIDIATNTLLAQIQGTGANAFSGCRSATSAPKMLRDCLAQGFLLCCRATQGKTDTPYIGVALLVPCGSVLCVRRDIQQRRCHYAVRRP
jgi:hypothetical protein